MDEKDEYVARMEAQMKKWDADVHALAAESEKASAEGRAAYHEYIEHVHASRHAAHKTFQELQVANLAAGAKIQAKMGVAWDTMQKALAKVTADLRK